MNNRFGWMMIGVGCLALSGLPAWAGSIGGLVVERDRPLAGAELILSGSDGVVLDRALSDAEGRFLLTAAPGLYGLGVFRDDYQPVRRKDLQVGDAPQEITVEMTPAAFANDQAVPEAGCD